MDNNWEVSTIFTQKNKFILERNLEPSTYKYQMNNKESAIKILQHCFLNDNVTRNILGNSFNEPKTPLLSDNPQKNLKIQMINFIFSKHVLVEKTREFFRVVEEENQKMLSIISEGLTTAQPPPINSTPT